MQNLVHPKEKTYYRVALVFSLIVYGIALLLLLSSFASGRGAIVGITVVLAVAFYAFLAWAILTMAQGYFVARVRRDAVRIGERQFAEVYAIVKSMAAEMGLKKVPAVYLLQAGGALNAFATKFLSRDFVVVYSDVFELAYEQGEDALRFIIGHELGHLHRKHLRGRWKILPGFLIPFLAMAYFRACEYTCDRYGKAFGRPSGSQGLLILGAGKALCGKVDEEELMKQTEDEKEFFMWLAEINASHPNLARRIKNFREFAVS